jgi:catechol 2,3-dioxygenase-like lactoylglutathione lyase family enzyme
MFDHIGIGVSDLKASKAFFLQALSPMGVGIVMEFSHAAGLGQGQKPSFWIGSTEGTPLPLHIAFAVDNRKQVDEFYRQALAAGGKDNGPPGIRAHYHANYYAAFVIGPDGHNVEVVCHHPEAT